MNWLVTTYLSYLIISVALTIWVARTLPKNDRIFLVDSFLGNEPMRRRGLEKTHPPVSTIKP